MKIAVTVPFDWMVSQYTQVLTERLLRWFDLSNLVVGTPVQLQGHRCEIVLVCGLRNSVKAGLACYHSQLPIALTRSTAFVWVVSATDTLSEIDTLKPLLTFLRQNPKLVLTFAQQKDWKDGNLSKAIKEHSVAQRKTLRADGVKKPMFPQ